MNWMTNCPNCGTKATQEPGVAGTANDFHNLERLLKVSDKSDWLSEIPARIKDGGWYYDDHSADEIANNAIDDLEECLTHIEKLMRLLEHMETALKSIRDDKVKPVSVARDCLAKCRRLV